MRIRFIDPSTILVIELVVHGLILLSFLLVGLQPILGNMFVLCVFLLAGLEADKLPLVYPSSGAVPMQAAAGSVWLERLPKGPAPP